MSPPVFLVETAQLARRRIVLAGSEGRHAAHARRLQPGERVDVTDGAGRLAQCVVTAVRRDGLDLDVADRQDQPAPEPRLVVVQALPKGDRGELAVEMLTEVGVDVVVPWVAARSVMQWKGDRGERALAKWRATAREAGKQARRAWLPEVREAAGTRAVCELLAHAALPLVLHEEAVDPLAGLMVPAQGDVVLVVGPEGGVAEAELAAFAAVGGRPVRLGPTVLRTSTAGVAALAVVLARSGRWA